MYIIHNVNDFNKECVYFANSTDNTVITDGKFTRIIYSTNLYTVNSILFNIKFSNLKFEYNYTKYKCCYDPVSNKNIIDKLIYIENAILESISNTKKPVYNIKNQILTGCIKFYEPSKHTTIKEVILKISGIWENTNEFGLTYKFMLLTPT